MQPKNRRANPPHFDSFHNRHHYVARSNIELFRSQNFTGAKVVFQKVLDISKESLIAKSYLDRCDKLSQNAPTEDWSFVNVFEKK
jgi:hypothetical protein